MRRHALLGMSALAALSVMALAACGSQGSSGVGTSVAPSAPAGGDSGTSLTITVLASPDAQPESWTLTCDPAGGTHPDAAGACAALAAADDPFKPASKEGACTQIYGGPQTATVTGTYEGTPVDASFSRTDGCEISRWDAIAPTLVSAGGA